MHRILTDPQEEQAVMNFKYLDLLLLDFKEIGDKIHYISGNKNFSNLKFIVKSRIIWLLGQLTPKDRFKPVPFLGETVLYLIRQLPTCSDQNAQVISLINDLLDVIESNLGWFVEQAAHLIPIITIGIMRLIPEHLDRDELKAKEVKIVIPFLRNNVFHFL